MRSLKAVQVVLASYSDVYRHRSSAVQLTASVLSAGKYLMDSDARAQQVGTRQSVSCTVQLCIFTLDTLHNVRDTDGM